MNKTRTITNTIKVNAPSSDEKVIYKWIDDLGGAFWKARLNKVNIYLFSIMFYFFHAVTFNSFINILKTKKYLCIFLFGERSKKYT